MARKRRSAAQKAATRKLVAWNRARRARRRNPAKAATTPLALVNPRRRRAKPKHRRTSAAAATVAGRTLRYRRRNPTGLFADTMNMLVPSAIGGLGALGVDVVLGMPFLPVALRTGPLRPVARVGAAIGLGFVAGAVGASRQTSRQIAAGALTVVMYDTLKGLLARTAGGRIPGIGEYEIPGVGLYEVTPETPQVGYTGAGQTVGQDDMGVYVDGDTVPDEGVAVYVS